MPSVLIPFCWQFSSSDGKIPSLLSSPYSLLSPIEYINKILNKSLILNSKDEWKWFAEHELKHCWKLLSLGGKVSIQSTKKIHSNFHIGSTEITRKKKKLNCSHWIKREINALITEWVCVKKKKEERSLLPLFDAFNAWKNNGENRLNLEWVSNF